MGSKPYYCAYEVRYQKAYEAGAKRWGHEPEDDELKEILTKWVDKHNLRGKRTIEFACGEGASGVILSELGCTYHGVDIAPSAIAKAESELKKCPKATVELLDMVNQKADGIFDAALDVMGFHMLVTDGDRAKYLSNIFSSLQNNSPVLFIHESYRADAENVCINSYADWENYSHSDYNKPEQRFVHQNGEKVEVWVPLLPCRAKNKDGYIAELNSAGFIVDDFIEMETSYKITTSATISAHKP